MKKKKWKVEIPDSALKDVPEEEREGLVAEIKKLFSGEVDPAEIGQPIERLPEGARYCPECGTELEPGPTMTVPGEGAKQIFDCPRCDRGYLGEPLN